MVSHHETNGYHNSKQLIVTTQNKPIFIKIINKINKKRIERTCSILFLFYVVISKFLLKNQQTGVELSLRLPLKSVVIFH